SLSDDALTAVPRPLRDGALALGATRSETIRNVLLPAEALTHIGFGPSAFVGSDRVDDDIAGYLVDRVEDCSIAGSVVLHRYVDLRPTLALRL
ncbi:MAG: hypothetical protein AAF449_08085, partial [Myxococcota bacterium]